MPRISESLMPNVSILPNRLHFAKGCRPRHTPKGIYLWLLAICFLPACDRSESQQRKASENQERTQVLAHHGSYDEAKALIANERTQLARQLSLARSSQEKEVALGQARQQFVKQSAGILAPYWYGTRWDFNGISEKPREGKIACGYFVSTILRHTGVEVNRYKLAQQASGHIIQSLVDSSHIKRSVGISIDEFLSQVRARGQGLFIVGLDRHVGFLLYDDEGMFFLHSSATGSQCVMKEKARESSSLRRSRYRVLGSLSHCDQFISNWLEGVGFAVVTGRS